MRNAADRCLRKGNPLEVLCSRQSIVSVSVYSEAVGPVRASVVTTPHLFAQASASVLGVQEEGGASHLSGRTRPQPCPSGQVVPHSR